MWLGDSKSAEYCIRTYDDAYIVISMSDTGELTEIELSCVQRMEDREVMRKFWCNVSEMRK